MPLPPRWWFVGVAIVVGGCADPVDRSTDWNYLHATIIEPSCATTGCHSAATAQKDIDLSSPESAYFALTSIECAHPCQGPDASPICGQTCERVSDCDDPDLSIDELEQIRCWDDDAPVPCDSTSASCSCRAEPGNLVGVTRQDPNTALMSLLRGDGVFFPEAEYQQMPVDVPLTPAEMSLIERWIEEGASCD